MELLIPFDYSDLGLLGLRICVAAIFLKHGLMKQGVWKKKPSAQEPASMLAIMKILSIAEPLGAIAVLFGFMTQLAAAGLAIIMIGAIWTKIKVWKIPFYAKDNTGWEFDFMILGACIALICIGPGSLSLEFFNT